MTISKPWAIDDDVIGSYRILRLLGRGGMGEVYLAWTGLRLVAVKVLGAQHATDATFSQMFLAEARMAARLTHSGIAKVLDVGTDGGRLYMVMEYVAGHTLDELLRDPAIPGLMPLRIAVASFAYVAHALATAHRGGIVHRDISPHNLLVSDTGAIKIIDFGIARADSGDVHTSPGTFRGRFGYMAPEYVQGLPCDHRVDLFALGVVMWETFARQRLYAGTAAAQLFAMVERPAERLDALIGGFPIELADIVARLLERDPAMRYGKGDEVAAALERLLPALPDDGFRNLEHWVSHHLSARIEARARTDREALQQTAGEDAATRLAAEVATSTLEGERTASEGFALSSDGERTAVEVRRLRNAGLGNVGADEASLVMEMGGGTSPGIAPVATAQAQGAAYQAETAGAPSSDPSRPGDQALVRLLGDQRRGLILVAALSGIVVILSLWLGLRGEMRAREAARQVENAVRGERASGGGQQGAGGGEVREERAAPGVGANGTGSTGTAPSAPGSTGEAPGAAGVGHAEMTADAMTVDAVSAAAPLVEGEARGPAQDEMIELDDADDASGAAAGSGGAGQRGAGERASSRPRGQRRNEAGSRREVAATPAAPTAPVPTAAPVAPLAPEVKAPPLVNPPAPPPAAPSAPPAATKMPAANASPPAATRTPRVPAGMMGDEARGASVIAQCNACHAQKKARRVEGKQKTSSQWERFFRNGAHDSAAMLGGLMTMEQLAAAKAFLMPRGLESSSEQGAGVR
jgi:predicted Ser/Thr protein kinase